MISFDYVLNVFKRSMVGLTPPEKRLQIQLELLSEEGKLNELQNDILDMCKTLNKAGRPEIVIRDDIENDVLTYEEPVDIYRSKNGNEYWIDKHHYLYDIDTEKIVGKLEL